ncbi:MAG: hypothetical protein KAG93_01920 [Desulfuromusa sp.]|nr:hypothetical protein [Desulfuromusa sp.]
MRRILSLLLVIAFSNVTAQAMTYSCRDKQGQLYMTDNLQSLPPECLGRTNTIQGDASDSLSFVPGQTHAPGSGENFQKAVSNATREQDERKKWLDNLLPRVENVVMKYQQAVKQIYATTRSGKLRYRELISEAKKQKQQALAEKQQILAEISGQKISRKDRGKITSMLDEVKD